MPIPRVVITVDPAQLLERAVDGLFPLAPASDAAPWPTLSAWIVLRQGGLRDDLHRLAAAQGVPGWFDSPVCLFNELAARWSAENAPRPLSEPERLTFVAALVERFGGRTFGAASSSDAWVPPVDALIGELIGEGIAPDAFARALDATAHDPFTRDRAASLARIYSEWHAALDRIGRSDARSARVRLAATIAADPTTFAARLGGRRDVRIVGLADLRGGWRQLIAALAVSNALDRVEIITSSALQLPAELNAQYLADTAQATFASALFSDQSIAASAVRLLEAPDAAREVELIAVRVRALIDAGINPRRIAVITRQARPLVNDMSNALAQLGVPVTARRRANLAHTAPARALRAILTAAAESWSRHSVVELAENPLLHAGLDAGVLNAVGFARPIASRAAWREALGELLDRCNARATGDESEDERRQALPPLDRVNTTVTAWNALDPILAALEAPRMAGAWFSWIANTLRGDAWGIHARLDSPIADRDVWNADIRGAELIAELALAWTDALDAFGGNAESIATEAFAERLDLLLDHDLVTPPATDFGVVVGEALAAGWRAFDHVFVVGLATGAFPARPAPGGVLDADDRRALIAAGLPIDSPDAWRDRERELFRVVCAAPRTQLTLSWPVMDSDGRDVTRSAFVDEAAATLARSRMIEDHDDALEAAGMLERVPTNFALVPSFPVASDASALDHARSTAARENARGRIPNAWNGSIEDPALVAWLSDRYGESFVWSATQLENVAKCRWHWFAGRLLHLDSRGDPDDSMEPTTRGAIMHAALHGFFTAIKTESATPVYLTDDATGALAAKMTDALHAAWSAADARREWLGPPPLRTVARDELRADLLEYLTFEIDWNNKSFKANTNASKQIRTGFVAGELAIDRVELNGGGVPFLLRGSIDRVDHGIDDRIANAERYIAAIDYKSTKYSTPASGNKGAWDDGVVLQVPLYAAALRKMYPGSVLARMEYRTLRSPEPVHSLAFTPLKKGEIENAPDAEAKLEGALKAAGERISQVRNGELPASPAPSCGCSPYCPARDICRIPGGPESTGWL